jgi:drug/metabolite transporter (DMT)-like permease
MSGSYEKVFLMVSGSYPLTAALWMIGAMVSFSVMAIAGRELAGHLSTFEIMLYRSVIGFVIVVSVISITGRFYEIKTNRLWLHLLRNIAHFSGQNLWFLAVAFIPFSQLFALEFSTPIWVALLAPFFLNETLTRSRLAAVVFGFVGVLIVARPDVSAISPAILAAISCAVCFAGSMMATKKLTADQSTSCILFWLTAMQLVMAIGFTGYDGHVTLPQGINILWVGAVGLGGLTAHFCITKALSVAPAIIVMPLDFMRLPLVAVIGFLFYGEALEWPIMLGAVIILAANVVNLRDAGAPQKPS